MSSRRRELPVSEQQSSTVVVFRALVMLVCLIAIPLAALFGSSLPTLLKALKEGKWPLVSAAQAQTAATEGPKFVPSGKANGGTGPAPAHTTGNSSQISTGADRAAAGPAGPYSGGPSTPSGVIQAGYDGTVDPPASSGPGRFSPVNPAIRTEATAVSDQRLVPVPPAGPNLLPVDGTGNQASSDATGNQTGQVADRPGSSSGTTEPFLSITSRLQQMGATRYILEAFGDQGQDYRFICWMAVGGNPKYTRHFWAIDSDPLKAMSQVLQQVETSRTAKMAN
jgi:hypothetical protein